MVFRLRLRTILMSALGKRPQAVLLMPICAKDRKQCAEASGCGAILLGKTQSGPIRYRLVGVRSPYGAVSNSFDPAYVSGGSSSGSASVVARGLVSFSLGTDTAGSGRVPAAYNNIVGMKPTPGLSARQGGAGVQNAGLCFHLLPHRGRCPASVCRSWKTALKRCGMSRSFTV